MSINQIKHLHRFTVGANLVFAHVLQVIQEGEHKVRPYDRKPEV